MTLRYLRWVASLVVLVWVVWEIRSEPPFVLLLLAFVAAWGLFIDFLINLPREIREWRAARDSRDV
jgi:hypothetical protein